MSKAVPRLFRSFQPEQYDVTLDFDLEASIAKGTVVIKGKKVGRPTKRLTFHGKFLKVTAATVTRYDKKSKQDVVVPVERINLQKTANEIRLHSDSPLYVGDYTVTMEFTAPIQDSMHGIYRSNYKLPGQAVGETEVTKTLVSTQFESHHAREAFPCIDEPEAKATFDLILHTPSGQTVLSNMPVKTQQTQGDQLVTSFETTPRMSTYLLALTFGELQSKATETKDGVAVTVWSTYEHRPEALDFALETGKRCIEFFNDYYGTAYPLPKCDMVAIPSFSAGAMENWGLVTYRDSCLLADPATSSQSGREVVALVVCHELSHQWFGNLVTMRWWNDLWLNESFANVMEYVAVDHLFPEWHVFNSFVGNEGLAAFRRDSIAGVQSIKTEVKHPDEINSLFDPSIVYAKGGRLLNMLRNYVGDGPFRTGLAAYFAKHQYANTTGDDLWAAIGQASGKDIAAFMNPWLEKSGYPLVTVKQDRSQVEISQSHFLIDPAKADDRRWPVPLLASSPDLPQLLEKAAITTNLSSDSYVHINQGAVGHYIVRYANPDHMTSLAQQAQDQSLNEVERLMLLSDSGMLARNGADSLASTLRLLDFYTKEASEPVWDIISLTIGDCRRFEDSNPVLEHQIKEKIRSLIESQYQRLSWEEQPDESSQDTKLRATILGLGAYAEHPEIKTRALELFEAYRTDTSVVASELRGIIFTAAVRYAARDAFAWALQLEETTSDPNLKQELLAALSSTRSPEEGMRLLDRLKDSTKVRQHDVDRWLVYLMRNRYNQAQAWEWLRNNWDWIEQTFGGDKSYDSFPRYAASAFNTRQRLEEYRSFFGPKTSQPALTLNINLGIEELQSRISWIERDLEAVTNYFDGQ
jgi:aminopeptidase N